MSLNKKTRIGFINLISRYRKTGSNFVSLRAFGSKFWKFRFPVCSFQTNSITFYVVSLTKCNLYSNAMWYLLLRNILDKKYFLFLYHEVPFYIMSLTKINFYCYVMWFPLLHGVFDPF